VSVWETVLIYVVPPVVAYLVLAGWILGRRSAKRARYRTGEAWEHEPVLWTAHPGGAHGADHGADHAEAHGSHAVTAGSSRAAQPVPTTGGARGHW
jgi:hypothetical protein